jgi:hypothetical protein
MADNEGMIHFLFHYAAHLIHHAPYVLPPRTILK